MENNRPILMITGSNGGLGCQIVKYLLENDACQIACHYRSDRKNISKILLEHDLDPTRHCFKAELTNEEDVATMREKIESTLGPVETLVNLAGGSINGVSWKMKKHEFQNVVDMNLTSTFVSSKEFIPTMRKMGSGTIINISSVVGSTGVAGASAYCAAKAGINGLSKALSHELASKNISVNTLALGYFNTGIIDHVPQDIQESIKSAIPMKRFGDPSEIGALIAYLSKKEARYITGHVFHVNGGLYS